jgi:sortase A
VANYIAERNGSQAIAVYDETLADLDPDALAAAREAAEVYNQTLTGQPVHDPFIAGTGMALTDDYWQALGVSGIMGYIEIPKLGLRLPIYHGTSEAVLLKGIGHLEGTTLPIGGLSRHSVLTGHTGLSSAKLFTDLVELQVGDQFYLHVLGETLAYAVDKVEVVEPSQVLKLGRVEGKDYVTLLTCTPYGINSHRLLVRGERVDYDPNQRATISKAPGSIDRKVLVATGITAVAMFGLIIAVFLVKRRRDESTSTPASDPRLSQDEPPSGPSPGSIPASARVVTSPLTQ